MNSRVSILETQVSVRTLHVFVMCYTWNDNDRSTYEWDQVILNLSKL